MLEKEAPVTMDSVIIDKTGGGLSWIKNKGVLKLNMILLLAQISSYATGYDGSMMNGLQSLDTWRSYFNNPDASQLALLNVIQSVGQLVCIPICAPICDTFGRKPALLASALVMLIGVALQGASQNTGMFIGARAVIGFGLALNITAAPLLIMELAYPSHRAPLVSVYNSLWGLGALVAAWVTYGTFRLENEWAWRIPSWLQAASSLVQIALFYFVEESPRWLVSRDRDDEARALLVKYHADGDEADPLVQLELDEIRAALHLEREAAATTSYLTFFQTPGNRRRFWIILAVSFFSQWSGNGLISYYLTLVLDSIGYSSTETQTLINALLTVWSMVWSLAFSLVVNRVGRRTLFLASTVGCLVVFIVWTALEATYEQQTALAGEGSDGVAKGVLAMLFLYYVAFAVGWSPLQVTYVIEILPYNLRARGLVLYNLFVSIALIFNQYVNPIGLTNSGWKYYITYDVWLAFEAVVVWFLFVETGNLSLEETAAILDGDDLQHRVQKGLEGSGDAAAASEKVHTV